MAYRKKFHTSMNRRTITTFLRMALAILPIICCTTGCNSRAEYITVNGFAQGGTFHLVYQEPANATQYNVPDSLAKYFAAIDSSLSGYDSTSIVSRINRGENPQLDSLFIECFNIASDMYIATEGVFDISAAPLFDIWGFGFREREEISQDKIDSIKAFVGTHKLSIAYDSASKASYLVKADPRMQVNFNAIAQGYTCDYICRELEKMGVSNYLLEVGGEILCKGVNPKGKEWNIAIDKPLDGNFIPGESVEAIISLSGKGLVTSGNYRKFYIIDGKKYSHTINPVTGYPVQHNLLSATVMAPTAAVADAYATYLMAIGLQESVEFLKKSENLDALLVYGENSNMKVYSTPGVHTKKIK